MNSASPVTLLVPGDPEQLTGGYVYNRRIAAAVRKAGGRLEIQGLEGRFPETDDQAREAADTALANLPDGSVVMVDGLALGGLPEIMARHRERLCLLALIHHPLADETGLSVAQAARLRDSETRALAQVRGVVTTSPFTAARLRDFQVPPERIQVVEPGVEPAPSAEGSPGEPRLLCIASLLPRKGQDLLVQALAQLQHLDWHCDLIGSLERNRPFAAQVQALIDGHNLGRRVRLLGEQPEAALAAYYHRASLFVLPSHYEGYGMVITEALARGLPVLTTDGGALRFTLPDQAGIKVPAGDLRALTDALGQLLSQPQVLSDLRQGASRARSGLQSWDEAGARFQSATAALLAATTSKGEEE